MFHAKRLANVGLSLGLAAALIPAAKGQALPTATPAKTVSIFGGDRIHHWQHRSSDDCTALPPNHPSPFGSYPGFEEEGNQIVAGQITSGRNAIGAATSINSCGDRIGLAFYERIVFKKNFGRIEADAGLAGGVVYGYKPGDQIGVRIGSRLVSPMVGVLAGIQVRLSEHWSAGVKGLATPDFVTKPLYTVTYHFGR